MSERAHRDSLLIAVLAGAALCAYLWLALGLAGLALGSGWPHMTLSELLLGLTGWASDPGDPAAGFPAAVRSQMPGALGVYATLVVVSSFTASAIYALRHSQRASAARVLWGELWGTLAGPPPTNAQGARWARPGDLKALAVKGAQRARLTIGHGGSQLLAVERRHSLLVVGPTQSGKTSGLAIPALLEWQGPVLATSVKGDLLAHTEAARRRCGPVWVYDPAPYAARECATWNPLEHCRTWQGARRMAQWLVSAAQAAPGRGGEARFWSNLGEKLLSSLLFAAAASGREVTMVDVVSWMNRREVAEVERCLAESGDTLAREAWESSISRHEQTISSVYASVESVLAAYGDPDVLATTIGEGISGERLIESGGSVYVCAPPDEQERLAPLFAALVREVIAAAYDRYARTHEPLDPPLLILLDEAGNIAPVPGLAKLAATAAGVGVQLVSVWQDLAQLHGVYGEAAETVVNNHRAKLVLSGVADERTVRWVRELLGDERRPALSRTHGDARRSYTESTVERPLAPAYLTRQQQPGQGILVYGALPPARVRLRPYFSDRRLRSLAQGVEAPERASARLLGRIAGPRP